MFAARRVIVTGATGLIGKALCAELASRGYAPIVFSRDPAKARRQTPKAMAYVAWQPGQPDAWQTALDSALGVIHLAGAPVFGPRWTAAYKQQILDSRVHGTRTLVEAMARVSSKPQVFISASAIGIYGFRDDTPLDETAPPSHDFLAQVCVAWEASALPAESLGIRTVLARIGIVLAPHEGAFPLLAFPMRLGLGGPILPGSQWVSWVHVADVVAALLLALDDPRVSGPINIVAPDARTNRDFMATLARLLGRPSWLPVPGLALRLALGGFAETLTTGQRVVPSKLQLLGHDFRYSTLEPALHALLNQQVGLI